MKICKDGCGTENPDSALECQHCGQSLDTALRLRNVNTFVRTYRVLRIIGHGGFGAVYAAEDTRHPGQYVALKESLTLASIRSLQTEFATLQNLDHDNLPRYDEVFAYEGKGYLVMELVEGQNLAEILADTGGPLKESQVLGYAIQLCAVLSYLHTRSTPIFHRDVKPANIRLTPQGLIKLVDFGLVKQGTQTTHTALRGLGTLAYAPLEQYGGAGQHTDQRSDVYSLGATLYHLLTGKEPLPVTQRIVADQLPLLREVNEGITPPVATAITKALCLKPEERYPDIVSFKDALLDAARSVQPSPAVSPTLPTAQPVATVAPQPPSAGNRFAPLAILLGTGAGLVALIVMLVLAFAGKGGQAATPTAVVTASSLPTAVSIAAVPALATTVVPTPSTLPTAVPPTATLTAVPPTATPTVRPTELIPIPEMVAVPAGDFLMGSTNSTAEWDDEKPQHTLTLPAYEIGKTEVTNAQFRYFVEGDGYTNQAYWDAAGWQWRTAQGRTQPSCGNNADLDTANHPVVCVTWYEAMAYARWLSARTGLNFSLPTEAEWEKAARGTDGRIYPWGNTWDAGRANSGNVIGETTPVGQYPRGASPYGALDMAGNVWEWTQSMYALYPYDPTDGREDIHDPTEKRFMLRGGSWNGDALNRRIAFRVNVVPTFDNLDVGVRLVRHP